jgi:hypothetical protein
MGSRHYSSSKIVEWMREKIFKIDKPFSLGWGQWAKWDADLKKSRPFAFFVTETLPDWLEYIPKYSIDYVDNLRYYIVNRCDHSHRLDSKLAKGKYYEFEEIMLHSMFDSYIDFIEIETANSHISWGDKELRAKYNLPLWRRIRWLRWGSSFRCPQAAIDHLQWEMNLEEPTHQKQAAFEKMELYTWWKDIRPTREDSWEASGFGQFWKDMDKKYGGKSWLGLGGKSLLTPAEKRTYDKFQKEKDDLEQEWEDQDSQMMIRLVKLRKSLWT